MIGSTLAQFRITGRLGAGGMGEVYRAEDTRLGREVAIKVLPERFASDPDRLARFEREARTLASLSHPHIAAIHEIGEAEIEEADRVGLSSRAERSGIEGPGSPRRTCRFLVMELVVGENLAERLDRSPLALDQARAIARQVAAALEAAHERGIIHRDLKPANVMIDAAGRAKVLDFGLAKLALAGSDGGAMSAGSPTLTYRPTAAGVILGTAPYLSPEQARGGAVDARTDVWAFGCLLYEMLAGRPAFPGETAGDSLVAVLERDPDWSALPAATPPLARWVLRRCLEKEPGERLHAIADARLALEGAAAGGEAGPGAAESAVPRRRRREVAAWIVAGVLGAAAALLAVPWRGRDAPEPHRVALRTDLGGALFGGATATTLAVSPDGASFVYGFADAEGARLRHQRLADPAAVDLAGTEGAQNPFFSPDGRFLGFTAKGTIWRMELPSGPPRTLFELPRGDFVGTPSWGSNGTILFAGLAPEGTGIFAVPAEGGEPRRITRPAQTPGRDTHGWPVWLPGGGRFLFVGIGGTAPQLFLGSLGEDEAQPVPGVTARAVWVEPGVLVYPQGRSLVARRFDPEAVRWTGEPMLVVEAVKQFKGTGKAEYAAVPRLLVSAYAPFVARLTWFDREGHEVGTLGEPGDLWGQRFSPSGDRIAVGIADPETELEDLWIYEASRGVGRRLTLTPDVEEGRPVWSPDGHRVAFYSGAEGAPDIRVRAADGSGPETTLLAGPVAEVPLDWSPDGRLLLYSQFPTEDLWLLPVDGGPPRPFVQAPGRQDDGRFSPDGRWVAFESTELGRPEVFVAPATDGTARHRVSTTGGSAPSWGPDGRELFYKDGRALMAVPIETPFEATGALAFGNPRELFRLQPPLFMGSIAISPDGERFLITLLDEEELEPEVTLLVEWMEGLEQR